MAAVPYYLLAAGIVLIIAGYLIANLGAGSDRTFIDPKMSDKEIKRKLNQSEGNPLGGIVVLLGYLVMFAGIVWRVVRFFV
jgi:hypothetical protein